MPPRDFLPSDFRPSPEVRQRVAELISREKGSGLTPVELSELHLYMKIEHLGRLLKARARRPLDDD